MTASADAQFDAWAPYYDFIHEGLPGDVVFYTGVAIQAGGPALEIGCGTGRVLLPMALSGAAATGLDCSAAMLAICQENRAALGLTPERVPLVHADMRSFDLGRQFASVLMPYRTFMHLLTGADQRRCMACVARHLRPGGLLALNVWLPPLRLLREWQRKTRGAAPALAGEKRLATGETLRHFHRIAYDAAKQRIDEWHHIEECDASGALARRVEIPMSRTWLSARELEHIAAGAGLRTAALSGDFDGGPLHGEHSEIVAVFERPK